MLHLTKLAVGVRDIDHLHELQEERAIRNPPLRHRTRNFPRRHQEVIDGGSILGDQRQHAGAATHSRHH